MISRILMGGAACSMPGISDACEYDIAYCTSSVKIQIHQASDTIAVLLINLRDVHHKGVVFACLRPDSLSNASNRSRQFFSVCSP